MYSFVFKFLVFALKMPFLLTYLDKYPSSARLHFHHFSRFLGSFGVISVSRDYSLIFNIEIWSPDKEGEEYDDDDLEEDHDEDVTAGLHGLFLPTFHICRNTFLNIKSVDIQKKNQTNIFGQAVLFFHSVSTLLCI